MNFTAEYQLTFEEFKEATTFVRKSSIVNQLAVRHGFKRSLAGWAVFIGLAVLVFFLMNDGGAPKPANQSPPSPAPNLLMDVLLPFVPWIIIFGFVWFFIIPTFRGQYKRTWDQTPALHRVRTIKITEEGLAIADLASEHPDELGALRKFR